MLDLLQEDATHS